jgi:hypothetical protein
MRRKDGEVAQIMNHQTELILEPKFWKETAEWSTQVMEEYLRNIGVQRPSWDRQEMQEWNNLWGIMLTDLHFDSSDIKGSTFNKRVKATDERIKRVLDRVMKFDPDSLLISNLGDTFNTDGNFKTSSQKVALQNNMPEKEAFKRTLEWEIKLLEKLKSYWLPLKYVKLPWNHDDLTTSHSATALDYYFNGTVDIQEAENRFYQIRGSTLIALSHGDRGRGKRLFEMAVDEALSKTRKKIEFMYGYLWHQHKSIIEQVWMMTIKNLQAPNTKTDRCDKYWYDVRQSMTGYVWNKDEWEIAEVKG